jgi:hypothetical protein
MSELVCGNTTYSCNTADELRSAFQSILKKSQDLVVTEVCMASSNELFITMKSLTEETLTVWLEESDKILTQGLEICLTLLTSILNSPVNPQSLNRLLTKIAKSPTLVKVVLKPCFRHAINNTACMRIIGKIVRCGGKLRCLYCVIPMLQGSKDDFVTFAESFLYHPSLRMITFCGANISSECHTRSNVNLLLTALSTTPRLAVLGLAACCSPPLQGSLLQILHRCLVFVKIETWFIYLCFPN